MSICEVCGYWKMVAEKNDETEATCLKCKAIYRKNEKGWYLKQEGIEEQAEDPERAIGCTS